MTAFVMAMPPVVRGVRAAVTFLTRLPVGGYPYSADDWRWVSAHLPLVGAGIGAMLAAVWVLAAPLGALVAAALVIVAGLLITGGFHEDGLADTADALGGAHDRGRILEILKDSRIGAFGGLALTSSMLLRAALLAALGITAPVALVVAHGVSRAPPIWLMAALPYVTDEAVARSRLVARAGLAQAAVATGWAALLLAGVVGCGALPVATAVGCAAVAVAVALLCGWRFQRRAGGVTGDFLGATQQVAELAIYVVIVATVT